MKNNRNSIKRFVLTLGLVLGCSVSISSKSPEIRIRQPLEDVTVSLDSLAQELVKIKNYEK